MIDDASPEIAEEGKQFGAGVIRNRDFRIKSEALGDVMIAMLEQLIAGEVLPMLPPLAAEILWLMLSRINVKKLDVKDRMICRVSHGWLHKQTGRKQKGKKRQTGHIKRALDALAEAGLLRRLKRGNAVTPSKYEIYFPEKSSSLIRRRGNMSGRASDAGDGMHRAPAATSNKSITRAGGGINSAPAAVSTRRQRAMLTAAGARCAGDTLSCLDDDDDLIQKSSSGGAEAEAAVELLCQQGVRRDIAASIVADPTVRIAPQLFCSEIKRIANYAGGAKEPNAWWRTALRHPERYGPDPVAGQIQSHRARAATPAAGDADREGRKIVEAMDSDELMEAHVVLIEHYKRTGQQSLANAVQEMSDPRCDPCFWRAVGKNKEVLGLDEVKGAYR